MRRLRGFGIVAVLGLVVGLSGCTAAPVSPAQVAEIHRQAQQALFRWDAVAAGSTALANTTRRIYTGDGQTYTFYVLSYFVVLYAACGGFR